MRGEWLLTMKEEFGYKGRIWIGCHKNYKKSSVTFFNDQNLAS
jgi:hypothetical protein